MNEETIIPDWLTNIFLGYGDPAGAQYTNIAKQNPETFISNVDFKDTFLDSEHLVNSFPGVTLSQSWSWIMIILMMIDSIDYGTSAQHTVTVVTALWPLCQCCLSTFAVYVSRYKTVTQQAEHFCVELFNTVPCWEYWKQGVAFLVCDVHSRAG